MNPELTHYLNFSLGLGAIILQIVSVLVLGMLFFGPKKNQFLDYVNKHFLILSFLVALSASVFPLVYSFVIHFPPCDLCWWQRIFMFSTFILYAIALWDKDRRVIRYVSSLVTIGFLISIYHNIGYYFSESGSTAPCDASGVSCYKHLVSEFGGYISIPMLALTAFFALLTLLAVAHFYNKEAK